MLRLSILPLVLILLPLAHCTPPPPAATANDLSADFDAAPPVFYGMPATAEISHIDNLQNTYRLKEEQVALLDESIEISNRLFQSTRAEYLEVLLTQREALEARKELIETKQAQLSATVNLYQALGGGWK